MIFFLSKCTIIVFIVTLQFPGGFYNLQNTSMSLKPGVSQMRHLYKWQVEVAKLYASFQFCIRLANIEERKHSLSFPGVHNVERQYVICSLWNPLGFTFQLCNFLVSQFPPLQNGDDDNNNNIIHGTVNTEVTYANFAIWTLQFLASGQRQRTQTVII